MRKLLSCLSILLLLPFAVQAQQPQVQSSSEIFKDIQKLNFLGSVLYLAAHPDDENTKIISYFSNQKNARTAYLSLTRGDGGQNLIGPELREKLGIIRTQELLAARRIDGGEQYFTRANDFGYSKHPDETLEIWNEEEVLKDVVWIIRQFKPDVIINRFDHRTPGSTHGHHTSSALLSVKAFDLAGKPHIFQEQLQYVDAWQPKRMFYNTSWWFYGSQKAFERADKSDMLKIDTGVYFPLSGLSNTEISALSRSQHKSQGFGSTGTRGTEMEYIELIKGELPRDENNVFEGVNTSWSRIKGGEAIGNILYEVERNFDFKNPAASLDQLVAAYKLIQNLEDEHWRKIKSEEIKSIIAACAGLFVEASVHQMTATRGEKLDVHLEAINRSGHDMNLLSLQILPQQDFLNPKIDLQNNQKWTGTTKLQIADDAEFTTPYWLKQQGSLGMYKVEDQLLRGLPETPRNYRSIFEIEINGASIPFEKAIVYKVNDPIRGSIYTPFEVIPAVSVRNMEQVSIFADNQPQQVAVKVKSGKENIRGILRLSHPAGWQVSPPQIEFQLDEKGDEKRFSFSITPPNNQSEAVITPQAIVNGETFSEEILTMDYAHIHQQTVLLPAEFKAVKLNIQKKGKRIAYIEGAGDVVPQSLRQIGYEVIIVSPEDISLNKLRGVDAVVLGIRAYNTVDALKHKQDILMEYVKNGGNMIVQYNTSHNLKVDEVAPYKLEISRDRITDEEADFKFLASKHPVLNYPNKISQADFEGWVQERGLYFPDKWSREFTPILSGSDPGEKNKKGSLLVAQYGKGYYIYTGLSFFRQFPASVPGAYRLFANMISLGKEDAIDN